VFFYVKKALNCAAAARAARQRPDLENRNLAKSVWRMLFFLLKDGFP